MSPDQFQVLLVEDDEGKLRAVREFMIATYPGVQLSLARSFSSAMSSLDHGTFSLALLDMSLPTYDLAKDRGGGEPQGYGGRDLLRTLEAEYPKTKAVVLTQYKNFADPLAENTKSFAQLADELREEFGEQFLSMIAYSGKLGRWKSELRTLIDQEFFNENSHN